MRWRFWTFFKSISKLYEFRWQSLIFGLFMHHKVNKGTVKFKSFWTLDVWCFLCALKIFLKITQNIVSNESLEIMMVVWLWHSKCFWIKGVIRRHVSWKSCGLFFRFKSFDFFSNSFACFINGNRSIIVTPTWPVFEAQNSKWGPFCRHYS